MTRLIARLRARRSLLAVEAQTEADDWLAPLLHDPAPVRAGAHPYDCPRPTWRGGSPLTQDEEQECAR